MVTRSLKSTKYNRNPRGSEATIVQTTTSLVSGIYPANSYGLAKVNLSYIPVTKEIITRYKDVMRCPNKPRLLGYHLGDVYIILQDLGKKWLRKMSKELGRCHVIYLFPVDQLGIEDLTIPLLDPTTISNVCSTSINTSSPRNTRTLKADAPWVRTKFYGAR